MMAILSLAFNLLIVVSVSATSSSLKADPFPRFKKNRESEKVEVRKSRKFNPEKNQGKQENVRKIRKFWKFIKEKENKKKIRKTRKYFYEIRFTNGIFWPQSDKNRNHFQWLVIAHVGHYLLICKLLKHKRHKEKEEGGPLCIQTNYYQEKMCCKAIFTIGFSYYSSFKRDHSH